MRYAAAYRTPDHDDMGCCERSSFLLINSVGYYEFDEPYGVTHRKHGRKDFYLSYNHGSPMKLKIAQKEHLIGEGTVFVYRPFEEQYYGHADRNIPISNYWVHFTGYGASELLVSTGFSEKSIQETGVCGEMVQLFEKMIDEITEKKPGYEMLASSLLMQIMSLIRRKTDTTASNNQNDRDRRIQETMQYIHRNYLRAITVRELADMANLSASRYSGVFHQLNGISPQQYLINFRIQKACELMRHTRLNIRQIAALTGFEDQLYFSRLFRKYKGVSPSEYLETVRVLPAREDTPYIEQKFLNTTMLLEEKS